TLAEDLSGWKREAEELSERDIERRAEELQRVRADRESLRARKVEWEREQEQIPLESRRQPDQLRELESQARLEREAWAESLQAAQEARSRLMQRREQRRALEQECLAIAGRHKSYSMLAELLGRHRLQLHLVRRAESSIVDYANAVLDRLSEGQL